MNYLDPEDTDQADFSMGDSGCMKGYEIQDECWASIKTQMSDGSSRWRTDEKKRKARSSSLKMNQKYYELMTDEKRERKETLTEDLTLFDNMSFLEYISHEDDPLDQALYQAWDSFG